MECTRITQWKDEKVCTQRTMHALPPKKRIREDVCMAELTVRKEKTPEPSSALPPACLSLQEVRLRLTEDEALARALQEEEDVSIIIIINPPEFPPCLLSGPVVDNPRL